MNQKLQILFVGLVLVLHILGISWLIYRYERVVTSGTEVRFKTQPYDPYDPLRGRYLAIRVSENCDFPEYSEEKGRYYYHNKLYAKIEKCDDDSGLWKVVKVAEQPGEDGIWIKPKSSFIEWNVAWDAKAEKEDYSAFSKRQQEGGIHVEINLNSNLFVNEKIAVKADEMFREKSNDAVAVYRVLKDKIVLTDVEIDGTSITKLIKK